MSQDEVTQAARRALVVLGPAQDLVTFGRALDAAGAIDTKGVWTFFERPHKWASEYALWRKLGTPTEGDPAFDQFVAQLDAPGGEGQ
jgi:hypothetical protein